MTSESNRKNEDQMIYNSRDRKCVVDDEMFSCHFIPSWNLQNLTVGISFGLVQAGGSAGEENTAELGQLLDVVFRDKPGAENYPQDGFLLGTYADCWNGKYGWTSRPERQSKPLTLSCISPPIMLH